MRSVLVPSLVSLFGNWNWYLPPWAARVLRVRESHGHDPHAPQLHRPEPVVEPAG